MEIYTGMVLAGLIFLASLVSVELGISAAIIEIQRKIRVVAFALSPPGDSSRW